MSLSWYKMGTIHWLTSVSLRNGTCHNNLGVSTNGGSGKIGGSFTLQPDMITIKIRANLFIT